MRREYLVECKEKRLNEKFHWVGGSHITDLDEARMLLAKLSEDTRFRFRIKEQIIYEKIVK